MPQAWVWRRPRAGEEQLQWTELVRCCNFMVCCGIGLSVCMCLYVMCFVSSHYFETWNWWFLKMERTNKFVPVGEGKKGKKKRIVKRLGMRWCIRWFSYFLTTDVWFFLFLFFSRTFSLPCMRYLSFLLFLVSNSVLAFSFLYFFFFGLIISWMRDEIEVRTTWPSPVGASCMNAISFFMWGYS